MVASVTSLYPNTPRDLAVKNASARAFNITFNMPPDADSDGVQYYLLTVEGAGEDKKFYTPASCRTDVAPDGFCEAAIDAGVFHEIAPATRYNLTLRAHTDANQTLVKETRYGVVVRARNGIGWSDWSAVTNCTTAAEEAPEFPWIAVMVPGGLGILLLIGVVGWCWQTNKTKIIAPKLKKKDVNDEPLKDFVTHDNAAMEDNDPEVVMNPVLLARIAMEKEAKQGAKHKKKGGLGKTGGLARLGLGEVAAEKKKEKPVQDQVDEFLQERGVDTQRPGGGGAGPSSQPRGPVTNSINDMVHVVVDEGKTSAAARKAAPFEGMRTSVKKLTEKF